jgi:hypothetical protein
VISGCVCRVPVARLLRVDLRPPARQTLQSVLCWLVLHEQAGRPSPLQPTKSDTDVAYDRVVDTLLRRIAQQDAQQSAQQPASGAASTTPTPPAGGAPRTCVVVASHNQTSVQKALNIIEAAGIAPADERVYFAQVCGL